MADYTDGAIDLNPIRNQYKELLNDPKFEELEVELRKPNIFNILRIGRAEIRHSNFLAWLLDPNASHGLGNYFLIKVLRDIAIDEKNNLDILEISKLNFSNVEVNREHCCDDSSKKNFIDILIVFRDENDKLVICIENKIDTTDSDKQLNNYSKLIDDAFEGYKKVFLYLTPFGAAPKNQTEIEWQTFSYEENIIKHLENIQRTTINLIVKTYISDYLAILKNEIMGTNNKVTELANAIYNQYSELFDFVENNISDGVNRQIWEKDNKKQWLIAVAEKLRKEIEKFDNAKYELGFTKSYISIKRDNQFIYALDPNKSPNYGLHFNFSQKKNVDRLKTIDAVDILLTEKNIKKTWNKDNVYFSIKKFNEIHKKHTDIFQEIHKIRLEIEFGK